MQKYEVTYMYDIMMKILFVDNCSQETYMYMYDVWSEI